LTGVGGAEDPRAEGGGAAPPPSRTNAAAGARRAGRMCDEGLVGRGRLEW